MAAEMSTKRNMSPEETDAPVSGTESTGADARAVRPFDFSRIDRIPKSQIRAVRRMHENFTRNLATTLAGHLRVYVSPTLVSLEQISYGEFVASLEPPTCLAYVGLLPFDGSMVFEVSRPLAFAAVELLLGSSAVTQEVPARKLTEIERQLMQNLLRPVLGDYRDIWRTVAEIDFEVQSLVDEPQDLRVLTAAEAVVAVSLEVTLGSTVGRVNLAIPSLLIKRLRDRFEQLQSVRHLEAQAESRQRITRVFTSVELDLEVRVENGSLTPARLANLQVGDLLEFDHPIERPVDAYLNGELAFVGQMADDGSRLIFTVDGAHDPPTT